MDHDIEINTPSESVIAAYGTASWRRFLPQLIIMSCVIALLALVISFFWSLAASIRLPENTVFLGVATPRELHEKLRPEVRDYIPENWRLTVLNQSRWPVLFGAARQETTWKYFVIGPRWSVKSALGLPSQTSRLTRFLGEEIPPTSSARTTYLSWWGKTWKHPQALAQFETHPAPLVPAFAGSETAFEAIVYEDKLVTNISAPHVSTTNSTLDGDLFVRFDPTVTTTARHALLQALNLSDESTVIAPLPLTELKLQYTSSGTLDHISFQTEPGMSSSTKLQLLSLLGFSKRAVQTLPDGTTWIERRLPNESELQSQSSYRTPHGFLELTDTHYDLQIGSPTSTPTTFTSCNPGNLIARFSRLTISQLLAALDLPFLPIPTGIQLHSEKDHLVACIEP
jgi:hypothetical protein